ncbi:MAG TPA: aldehyde dehydrogenase family protein [Planctomycetota bacterium]|nr:aldehyde dehydrogenase family protein [Planctomycetota bacterium]
MKHDFLKRLGVAEPCSGVKGKTWIDRPTGGEIVSIDPATGEEIGRVWQASEKEAERVLAEAQEAFLEWRSVPAPVRGEAVRKLGHALREKKEDLGRLVTLEVGKILVEGKGEVQEMIDVSDFAVGLSRQLYGLTMPSERPGHRLQEQWHPLGVVGCITAFNFPAAVWAWNFALAAVCGDSVVWKPSELAPLTAVAVTRIAHQVFEEAGFPAVASLVAGGPAVGEKLVKDRRLPLVSFTGSTTVGRKVGTWVAERLGRTILEMGGNNAVIVLDDANQELALRACLFAAAGTAGQRCTTLRRLIVQRGIAGAFTDRLVKSYRGIKVGDPQEAGTLMGPLITERAVEGYVRALDAAKKQGGEVLVGGKKLDRKGFYVEPTVVRIPADAPIVKEETFAPILYVLECKDVLDAVRINNGVAQGLSSAIFTTNMQAAERFMSASGSDCGLANVNVGTSGAEIGGAFGGEKDTGGGRESGSDSWKLYMRRQTNTINWSNDLPLAQGITFAT